MKLADKGKFMPPPILDNYPQMVSAEIQKWDNIIAATHWNLYDLTEVDGADFYVGEEELGHIHLDGSAHMPVGPDLKKFLLDNKFAKRFPYGEDWVMFDIATKKDAAKAIVLFQVNYNRIKGAPMRDLLLQLGSLAVDKN
jgi:Family of unknown function (DUF5519)